MTNPTVLKAWGKIRSMAEQMQADERFTCVFREFAMLDAAALLDMEQVLAEEMGAEHFAIPKQVRPLYAITGGFRLQWRFAGSQTPPIYGSAELASPLELFQREGEPEPSRQVLSSERIFDLVSDDERVTVKMNPDRGIEGLFFYDEDGKAGQRLALDPSAYLVELAEHCAISKWQRFFTEEPLPRSNAVELDRQLEALMRALGGR